MSEYNWNAEQECILKKFYVEEKLAIGAICERMALSLPTLARKCNKLVFPDYYHVVAHVATQQLSQPEEYPPWTREEEKSLPLLYEEKKEKVESPILEMAQEIKKNPFEIMTKLHFHVIRGFIEQEEKEEALRSQLPLEFIRKRKCLSSEQEIALQRFMAGKNVFVSGSGGTGKSFLIHLMKLFALHKNKKFQITALTGIAAYLLGENTSTIHSWGGLGMMKGSVHEITGNILLKNRKVKQQWKTTHSLVIEEVSMMSLKMAMVLNETAQAARGNNLPFGGCQVVFCGDFFQLPPIGDSGDILSSQFCFEDEEFWLKLFELENHVLLTQNFRQENGLFRQILEEVRWGEISNESIQILNQRVGKKIPLDLEVKPSRLFPKRYMVDNLNYSELEALPSPGIEFESSRMSTVPMEELLKEYSKEMIEKAYIELKKSLRHEEIVILKVGCQVMNIQNTNATPDSSLLPNGIRGIVLEIIEEQNGENSVLVKFENGLIMKRSFAYWMSPTIEQIGYKQIPLVLSWAISIHKSQGQTLESIEVNLGQEIFSEGQTYVGLSRVKTLEGLYISHFDPKKIKANPLVRAFYEKIPPAKELPKESLLPLPVELSVPSTEKEIIWGGKRNFQAFSYKE